MKQALIIGATGGIGRELAKAMKDDYVLTLVGRDDVALRKLKDISERVVPTDVTSELELSALFDELSDIDVLIYAAGDVQPEAIREVTREAYQRVLGANLTGAVLTLKYAAPKLSEGARVFAIGARPELVSFRGFGAYAASKAALKALLEVAAKEMRKTNFTLVLPKAVATDFWEAVGSPPKDALQASEVAEAILESLRGDPEKELRVG